MGRSEGTVTCPVHKKKLLVHCRCLHPYGHGVVDKWLCPNCGDEVPWIQNWRDPKRNPYRHASGECRAKSSLDDSKVITESRLLTITLILLLSLFQEVALMSPSPSEREETAPLTCSPVAMVEVGKL